MSTEKSIESKKAFTECTTESDQIPVALNEISFENTTPTEPECDKKENLRMKLDISTSDSSTGSNKMTIPDSASDFNQWLQSMLAVARLPGGFQGEFRRKLWLALAERYLMRRGVDWEIEKIKWLSDKCRADDEELGIQIVKDLHRTGHSLLSGASGQLYQAKLKKILMGYTRWNPEVGYCQGFNMLGAIILQVMDKCEVDSIKVMIFLIEGLLPNGYFCQGLMGLQADMAVFRELLGFKLPKLARHLQKLQQSTNEPSFEPPIINVFTMQWFLTLFCNCLPMSYVLRIWDLIMIEGSDILLRTALSIWKLLEDRILREVRTADDFYCKMGTLSAELLNGTLIDSNRLVIMISTLGPINDLQQLRQKHLTASYNDQKQLKMLYSSAESDESRMAVASAWASRRGSQPKGQTDREKIALDITILKKQYDKLRERQKQAHIILSSAVSKQHQQQRSSGPSQVNKLLVGKNAIISKGRKGPPKGSVPPVRNQKLVKGSKTLPKQIKPVETLHWNNMDDAKKRRNSMTWKELNAERRIEEVKTMSKSSSASSLGSNSKADVASSKRRSDSSSYSEDSDCESSTSTSLCDDDITSSLEASPLKKKRHKDLPHDASKKSLNMITIVETSPTANNCPEISVNSVDDDNKDLSPIAKFYLDVSKDGDITSTSQLSPMPDLSSYFTAISPIQTPCNFFEFPDFSSFIMVSDEKFQVNEDGVTNEFFERVFEENVLGSGDISPISPDKSALMSKSFSPSILKKINVNKPPGSYGNATPKSIQQKSFSMDEQTHEKEEITINRSLSVDTIINVNVKSDGFEKVIAENLKILSKIIPRTTDSPDRLETHFVKLNLESTLIGDPKSPNNLSDVEEEIAAIDKVEECDIEGILLSDIHDIADIKVCLDENDEASLSYNTYTNDENVTEKNEKSINDETMATLACSPLEIQLEVEGEVLKALTVRDVQPKVEVHKESKKSESPKFNEIQLMVTKLKEEMEIHLKNSMSEDEIKAVQSVNNDDKAVEKSSEVKCEKITQLSKEIKEETSFNATEQPMLCDRTCNHFVDFSKVNDESKPPIDVGSQGKIETDNKESSCKIDDLEKVATESLKKIDTSGSDMILKKLNTQLEICQTNKILTLEKERNMSENSRTDLVKNDIKQACQADVSNMCSNVKSQEMEAKKDSKDILEKLNIQLQRYEETNTINKGKHSAAPGSAYSISKEKSTYETSAVMELATLIKERELEKLSEQKLLMKTSKELEYNLNLSPVRTPRSRSNINSPEQSNGKFNNFFYDHEPRSDVRRRDIMTLETEHRMRRPFKSSPTSSLSSSPSNISNTLSSIQNTIKILDSACQKTDLVGSRNFDKAMESIEKICDTDQEWKSHKKNKYESPPSFNVKVEDVSFDNDNTYQLKRRTLTDGERNICKNYDISPRPRRYYFDDIGTSLKNSKDPSPSRYSTKSKTPEIDPDYVAKLRHLSTEEYIAGRKSPSYGSREMLDVKFKIDRSPTSPTLSTSTHFSRSPRSPTSLLPSSDNRSSKSAENSPSRYSSTVEGSHKYNSLSGTIDSRADSMSNLSYKQNRKYENTVNWETPLNKKKYDFS